MKNSSLILVLCLSITLKSAFACDIDGKSGFLPKNDLQIRADAKTMRNDMTKSRFNEIINMVDKIYRPIIKDKGGRLKWRRHWRDDKVNAYANQWFSSRIIELYGGLARHELINDDAFTLVICHELGHHLGGIPQVTHNKWSSSEGQSDYFGALKCFRRIFEGDNNEEIVATMKGIPNIVKDQCMKAFTLENDISLCVRSAMAGKRVADLLGSLRSAPVTNFSKPDPSIVNATDTKHPAAQCRLDTYFQGSLCSKTIAEEVSYEDPTVGTCNRVENIELGARPLCWYKPDQDI